MLESFKHYNIKNVGEEVTLTGWVSKVRNLGGLVFIDLRNRTGIMQVVVRPESEYYSVAESLKNEYVIKVTGKIVERESKNTKIETGEIEVEVSKLELINKSKEVPFAIQDETNALEDTRLKYRYLDLRRESLKNNFVIRNDVTFATRKFLNSLDFLEVETPILCKSTPEGARDYLVPSRVNKGKFYALPQSPQIFKQLLMVSGFERYFQIAKCFRDEDLRADRQPEFTQIDIEMSFVDLETLYGVIEGMFKKVWKDIKGIELDTFPRLTWKECMERYGSDKPDIRYDMELINVSSVFANSSFEFLNGKTVKAIVAKNAASSFTRKDIDSLTENAKKNKAKSLMWFKVNEDKLEGASAKLINEEEAKALKNILNYENGDLVLFVADDSWLNVVSSMGATRIAVAKKLSLADPNEYAFLWVTEFPMYEYNDDGTLQAMHHPFTAYNEEDSHLLDTDPTKVRSDAYDVVLNGYELGSGSRRIYNQKMQREVFDRLGLSDDDINKKFGFFVEALKYGTPPHMGMGLGLERIIMLLANTDNIRDVVAFPKIQSAADMMNDAPSFVNEADLTLLGIKVTNTEE